MKRKIYVLTVLMGAGLAVSCRSVRHTKSSERLEAAQYETVHQRMQLQQVPMSRAQIRIPQAHLQQLPPQAQWHHRSGQASVRVRLQHDTIYVDATCDSLQQLVMEYERQLAAAGTVHAEGSIQEKKTTGPPAVLKLAGALLLLLGAGWIWLKIRSPSR